MSDRMWLGHAEPEELRQEIVRLWSELQDRDATIGRMLNDAETWIPVEEELPEEGINVLAWDGTRVYFAFYQTMESTGTTIVSCLRWVDLEAWGDEIHRGTDATLDDVTHWRLLPEPPAR
jgi:hypothetical protein